MQSGTLKGENVKKVHKNVITVLKLSFGQVARRCYGRKLHLRLAGASP